MKTAQELRDIRDKVLRCSPEWMFHQVTGLNWQIAEGRMVEHGFVSVPINGESAKCSVLWRMLTSRGYQVQMDSVAREDGYIQYYLSISL